MAIMNGNSSITKLLFFVLTCFFSQGLIAQDTIFYLNATSQVAKVIEIGPKQVKYKKITNPDGPVYLIERNTISRIVYANGDVDSLSNKPVSPAIIKTEKTKKPDAPAMIFNEHLNNTVYLSISDPFTGLISGGFEHRFGKGYFHYRIPFSIGTGYRGIQDMFYGAPPGNSYNYDNTGYYDEDKIFSTGLNLNYFPGGFRRLSFGFGPELEFGMFHYELQKLIAENPPIYESSKETGSYSAFMMSAVLIFNITEKLIISTSIGTGLGMSYQYVYQYTIDGSKYSSSSSFPVLKGGFQIGYKF